MRTKDANIGDLVFLKNEKNLKRERCRMGYVKEVFDDDCFLVWVLLPDNEYQKLEYEYWDAKDCQMATEIDIRRLNNGVSPAFYSLTLLPGPTGLHVCNLHYSAAARNMFGWFCSKQNVVVYDSNAEIWVLDKFILLDEKSQKPYICVNGRYSRCEAYDNQTRHLVGTNEAFRRDIWISWTAWTCTSL